MAPTLWRYGCTVCIVGADIDLIALAVAGVLDGESARVRKVSTVLAATQ